MCLKQKQIIEHSQNLTHQPCTEWLVWLLFLLNVNELGIVPVDPSTGSCGCMGGYTHSEEGLFKLAQLLHNSKAEVQNKVF